MVKILPLGARYENGYSSSWTCGVDTPVSVVQVLAVGS